MLAEQQVAAARDAWPGVELDVAKFERYVETRAGGELADLYLACACIERDPKALEHFGTELRTSVDRAVRKLGGDRSTADELTQRLRERLLVGSTELPARITEYTGRGALRAWLRVIATRELLDMRRREKFEMPLGARTLDLLPAAEQDPELQYLKANYRDAFRRAFRDAFTALEPLERDLLRRHHILTETIDELSARHGVHRATVARWVARARERLLTGTRERLATALQVSDAEIDTILNLIASRLDVSLRSQL